MKYVKPKYESAIVETEDIVTASSNGYEISQTAAGEGKIQLDFSKLFGDKIQIKRKSLPDIFGKLFLYTIKR